MKIGLVSDACFLDHRASGVAHPERPERLTAIVRALNGAELFSRFVRMPIRPATREELERAHTSEYLTALEAEVKSGEGMLDPDTFYSSGSWTAALAASGSVIDLGRKILAGELDSGLALVRPPGHHATRDRAMGFCLLNHVAVAAADLKSRGARVAIFDWDVHHGNGTEDIFYEDPDVLYSSIHEEFNYPGTGRAQDRGRGAGLGVNLNVPVQSGTHDELYLNYFFAEIVPAIAAFGPDLIFVSAGFDAHIDDPLGGLNLTESTFARMTDALIAIQPKIVLVLEGGYDLAAIGTSTVAVTERLFAAGLADEDHP